MLHKQSSLEILRNITITLIPYIEIESGETDRKVIPRHVKHMSASVDHCYRNVIWVDG